MRPFRRRRTPESLPPLNRLQAAAWACRLARELEPADFILGVNLHVVSDGQLVIYALQAGSGEIRRAVCTDAGAIPEAAEALGRVFTDCTVGDDVTGGAG